MYTQIILIFQCRAGSVAPFSEVLDLAPCPAEAVGISALFGRRLSPIANQKTNKKPASKTTIQNRDQNLNPKNRNKRRQRQ